MITESAKTLPAKREVLMPESTRIVVCVVLKVTLKAASKNEKIDQNLERETYLQQIKNH